jgi:cohesin complex subunit SA-1/2
LQAYSSLWDDAIKQFNSHSSAKVLTHAMAAIRYFMDATSLSNTNSTKILELEDELSTQLHDLVAGREDIETTTFSEDEVLALSAWCMRLSVLAGARNMTAWIEEDEGGKQSSAWDIVSALVERGRLGYKEEETVCDSIRIFGHN